MYGTKFQIHLLKPQSLVWGCYFDKQWGFVDLGRVNITRVLPEGGFSGNLWDEHETSLGIVLFRLAEA